MNKQNKLGRQKLTCAFCDKKIPFDFPQEIIEAVKQSKLVIFAGAGISTENKEVFPYSLYEDLKTELKIPKNKKINFEDLASEYCKKTDGRKKLLNKIKDRFDYIKSFPELHSQATEFHRELSTIFYIKDIITTNWDNYFEEECNAIPLVTDKDFAFWDSAGRKVFKIHGSINNYGTLTATTEDYKNTYKNLQAGVMGSNLKLTLATKTVLFVGYSFGDSDFNKIFGFIKKQMKDILPHSYIITPHSKINDPKFTVINTDATYFLSILKHKLIEHEGMLPDSNYNRTLTALLKIKRLHSQLIKMFDFKKNPEVLYCSSYQEGLIHAFERISVMKTSGEYSDAHHLSHMIQNYEVIQKKRLKDKRYYDIAYIEGYINGLIYFMEEELIDFPTHYIFGNKNPIFSYKEYLQKSKKAVTLHKDAYKIAKNITANLADGITISHRPFLL